jgi:hypothetical protein
MNNLYPFNTQFDEPHLSNISVVEAVELIYSQEELKQAEAQSYALGHEKGKIEGVCETEQNLQNHINQSIVTLLENIFQKINQSFKEKNEIKDTINMAVLNVARAIVEKVIPSYVEQHGYDDVEKTIKNVLMKLFDKQQVRIKVSLHNYSKIKAYFDDISAAQGHEIIIEQSTNLAIHDCFIEWEGGGACVSQINLANQINDIFDKHLNACAKKTEQQNQFNETSKLEYESTHNSLRNNDHQQEDQCIVDDCDNQILNNDAE